LQQVRILGQNLEAERGKQPFCPEIQAVLLGMEVHVTENPLHSFTFFFMPALIPVTYGQNI
jgi:hypothetical protein